MEQRIRFPPFESYRFIASELPIATKRIVLENGKKGELIKTLSERVPSFRLGGEDTWLIEQRYLLDGKVFDDSQIERTTNLLDHSEQPLVVNKQRTGWYLTPNPIHSAVRRFISTTVVILLVVLGYLFVEPLLNSFGIPGIGTGTVRIGALDYPMLAVIIIPLLFLPLALRVGANLADLVQQQNFVKSSPETPIVEIIGKPSAGNPLRLKIQLPEIRDDWHDIQVTWRVGALSPARDEVFRSLGHEETKQPPPGLTTELPHHWEIGLDDGTGGGEEAPMERREVKGGLFLRPMRVMEFGGKSELKEEEIILKAPKLNWPGTVSSSIIRIHWELIVSIQRQKGGPLLWVLPLAVRHQKRNSLIELPPTNDGRTESDSV